MVEIVVRLFLRCENGNIEVPLLSEYRKNI